jgi:hypothetical protein
MKTQRISALLLAVALQVLPVCRVAFVNPAVAPSGFAFVLRWVAAATASLGAFHAVSGASAAVAGVSNNNPEGPVTLNATGHVGSAFSYRIIVSNPGPNSQGEYFNAVPLPAGLTINTNVGGDGFITGTPTVAGTNRVTLSAGYVTFKGIVTASITISIQGAGVSPPLITGPPLSQTVQAGANVSFTVTATGAGPFAYRWEFATTNLPGATNSTLQLTNVQPSQSGSYTVFLTNSAGSASASATLTVNPPLLLANPQWANGSFAFDVTGPAQTNFVIFTSNNLATWTPVSTNFTADGTLHFIEATPSPGAAFFQATLGP